MKNLDLQTCIKDVYETVNIYTDYLYLGYFYGELTRKINFSRVVKNISIPMNKEKQYILNGNIISNKLNEMYDNPSKQSSFIYLTIINSVRGITMAMVQGIENLKFKDTIKKEIFNNNENWYLNFEGAIKFIRNVLSHNIRERITLVEEDYSRQKNWWRKNGKPSQDKIDFDYDYSQPYSIISKENLNYKAKVNIYIEWKKINNMTLYADTVNEYQNFMIAEFCYNIVYFIYKNVSIQRK